MELRDLDPLYAHMEWADALVWRGVLSHGAARSDDYILDGLWHIHLVQRAYLSIWTEQPVKQPGRDSFDGPEGVREWGRTYHRELADFLADFDETRLGDPFHTPWTKYVEQTIGGPATDATLGDMMLQVALHSVHHRAQVQRRLREVGGEPAMVDFIGWVWRGSPPPLWEGATP